ncbi:helix-turn-helix transcriptional regulator [Micromonospora sp. HM5-17]|jgi:DNA-binding PadR family transcriptional regulator|uniref:helix-turn-helix transcriptional regulator n=1 Tax=Micromonospora sp. HM5-17 TaxID=2487710 RepID=UPI000F45F975|nr:helix-turn-helix transcriptional regulator [Micromonospora sp. HM5-17]ROT33714.1 PadR family transcriptional regulator [Micromonospora sp. HM5-17]
MSTPHVLLGLLAIGPKHGYDLKRDYDLRLPKAKPLPYGQVYATLGRLERDGLVVRAGQDREAGPDRTSYAITPSGQAALDTWLSAVEPPLPHLNSVLLAKVIITLLVADLSRARDYLSRQRQAHAARLRELTAVKTDPTASVADVIAADYGINHLDADLRWLRTTLDRVVDLHREVTAR